MIYYILNYLHLIFTKLVSFDTKCLSTFNVKLMRNSIMLKPFQQCFLCVISNITSIRFNHLSELRETIKASGWFSMPIPCPFLHCYTTARHHVYTIWPWKLSCPFQSVRSRPSQWNKGGICSRKYMNVNRYFQKAIIWLRLYTTNTSSNNISI